MQRSDGRRCGEHRADEELEADHGRNRIAGEAEDRRSRPLEGTEGERLGRPDGHLHPPHGPPAALLEDQLHDVEISDAHPAAGDDGIAVGAGSIQRVDSALPRRRRRSRGRPQSQPSRRTRTEERVAGWRRGSGPGPTVRDPATSSSPVERTPTLGPGMNRRPHPCPDWPAPRDARREYGTRRGHDVADAYVLSGMADGLPSGHRMIDHDHGAIFLVRALFEHAHGIGAGRQGSAGHDAGSLARPDRPVERGAGHDRANDRQAHRWSGVIRRGVLRSQGVAVP